MTVETLIYKTIQDMVENSEIKTGYRQPLVGFARANDSLFQEIKDHISEKYLLPSDLLADAKTVVSFFLPFEESIIQSNRSEKEPSLEWLTAYAETNLLLADISEEIIRVLENENIKAVTVKPTDNFDRETLISFWSHKHTAYVAGLGTFGHNKMLITKAGVAGRFGSVVFNQEIQPTERPGTEFCLRHSNQTCTYCINHCPVGALKEEGLDKQKCYLHLNQFKYQLPEIGPCNACGKCAVGPCGMIHASTKMELN